jgi:hypothetical protein
LAGSGFQDIFNPAYLNRFLLAPDIRNQYEIIFHEFTGSGQHLFETFEKHPLSPDFGVRLKFQSSKYTMYSCG